MPAIPLAETASTILMIVIRCGWDRNDRKWIGLEGVTVAIPQNFLDDLHDRLNIVDVVSAYLPLKKKGTNYWGLCPFHHEKTPSFSVNESKQIFHCFGCGAGGTVIDFVMKLFDIPFRQAILRINADFALGLTWDKPDPAVRSAVLEARRWESQRKAELERLEGKHQELAAEHRYWWNVLKHFSPTKGDIEAGYIHPLYIEAAKKQPHLEYLLDELEETIVEVKADRGRKGTTAGKYSTGGPRQTA